MLPGVPRDAGPKPPRGREAPFNFDMDRCAIFIDGAYLGRVLKDHFGGARLDMLALAREIAGPREVLRTYYYDCAPWQSNPPTAEERQRTSTAEKFFHALNMLPRFEVRLGKLALRGRTAEGQPIFVQKRVDIMLGVDLVNWRRREKSPRPYCWPGTATLSQPFRRSNPWGCSSASGMDPRDSKPPTPCIRNYGKPAMTELRLVLG